MPEVGSRVLDYGCGAGQIVSELCRLKIDAVGCDVFYEGGDYSADVPSELLGVAVHKMEGKRIPFADASFDLVINNQVMEHVDDLDEVLREIHRVLKPGGKLLSLFPDKSVWREGHCGVPFLHWFPKGSQFRVYYGAAARFLGFGYFKRDRSVMQWSVEFCNWLDQYTHYRTSKEIFRSYGKYFSDYDRLESDWLDKRLGRASWSAAIPRWLRRFLVRKLMGLVFVSRKAP